MRLTTTDICIAYSIAVLITCIIVLTAAAASSLDRLPTGTSPNQFVPPRSIAR